MLLSYDPFHSIAPAATDALLHLGLSPKFQDAFPVEKLMETAVCNRGGEYFSGQ